MTGAVTLDPSNPLAANLVCYLRFNEGSGTNIANLITPASPATASTSSWTTVDGQTAYNYNGVAGRTMTMPHHAALNLGNTFTVAARVSVTASKPTQGQSICAKGTLAYEMDVDLVDQIRFNVDNNAVILQSFITVGASLRYFVASVNAGAGTLYVDGSSVDTGSSTWSNTGNDLEIGFDSSTGTKELTGAIAELAFWTRPLSLAEVVQLTTSPNDLFARRFLLVR